MERRKTDSSPDLGTASNPPLVGLTPLAQRVINACFVQGRQDQRLLSGPPLQADPGAKPDAAKLNTPSGLAVEACSELRKQFY